MRTIRLSIIASFAVVFVTVILSSNSGAVQPLVGQEPEPGGMVIGVIPDPQQFTRPAVPVVAVRAISGLSEPEANKKQQYLMKGVILENRSTKDISAVTVRWVIAPYYSRTVPLARGEFKAHDLHALRKSLRVGQRQTLKLSDHPRLFDLIKEIPNVEGMGNKFVFLIAVAKVVFEDGTSWEEEIADARNKSTTTN